MASDTPVSIKKTGLHVSNALAKLLLSPKTSTPTNGRQQIDAKIALAEAKTALTAETMIAPIRFIRPLLLRFLYNPINICTIMQMEYN